MVKILFKQWQIFMSIQKYEKSAYFNEHKLK